MNPELDRRFGFWSWLARGSDSRPAGLRHVVNGWLLLHLGVGIALALVVPDSIEACAAKVSLPMVGVLVGLTFAWAGNALGLLSSEAMSSLAQRHRGGISEYAFIYQLAVLVITSTLVIWGLGAVGVFDRTWPTPERRTLYFLTRVALFALTSLTTREAWSAVLGAQLMIVAKDGIERTAADARSREQATPSDEGDE